MKNNTNNRTTTKTAAGFVLQTKQSLQKGVSTSIYSFRLLATVLLLLLSSTTFAYIGIVSTSETCGTLCDGSIVVRTNGNAGPFEVSIQGLPAPIIFINQLGTDYHFNNLCVGHYSIEVENAYMCVTTLETDVLEEESGILEEIDIQLSCICAGGFRAIAPVIEGAVSYCS